jgi:tRNA dimethylallyltransferase
MDIGTAKLSVTEREGVSHHMLDVLDVTDEATAAEYQVQARPIIEQLQGSGTVPILVGGSMLYVAAVLNTFEFPGHDPVLRAELEARLDTGGVGPLLEELRRVDPIAASRVDAANPRRVVRALEVVLHTGQPFAAALPEKPESWQPVLELGLNSDRTNLLERLELRVARMWQRGLPQEVESLIPAGIRHGKTASRAIGYAQALAQLDGELTEAEAMAETQRLTARYARRQMSWFRRDDRIQWFDYQDPTTSDQAVARALQWIDQ